VNQWVRTSVDTSADLHG